MAEIIGRRSKQESILKSTTRLLVRVATLTLLLSLFGCASSSTPSSGSVGAAGNDAGRVSDASLPPAPRGTSTANPFGTPYPTQNVGWNARHAGVRGDILTNLALRGYAPASAELETIYLSTFFDPDKRAHELLLIVATEQGNPIADELFTALANAPIPGVAIAAIIGRAGVPSTRLATESDLITVRDAYHDAWGLLDAGFVGFGGAFDGNATPWIGMVDARTMEIVASGVGGIPRSAVVEQLDGVRARPPAYP